MEEVSLWFLWTCDERKSLWSAGDLHKRDLQDGFSGSEDLSNHFLYRDTKAFQQSNWLAAGHENLHMKGWQWHLTYKHDNNTNLPFCGERRPWKCNAQKAEPLYRTLFWFKAEKWLKLLSQLQSQLLSVLTSLHCCPINLSELFSSCCSLSTAVIQTLRRSQRTSHPHLT